MKMLLRESRSVAKKFASLSVTVLCFFSGAGSASSLFAEEEPKPALAAKVDEIFAPWDRAGSPGCAVAVIKDNVTVYSRGYGTASIELGAPITPTTVFYLASVSKQFTATAVALLEEQGKLSFDDDVRRYVPELPAYDRPITIHHLLHHTSGIRDFLELWGLTGEDGENLLTEQRTLDLIGAQKELNFSPGERYEYCNSGYFLLGLIVKRVTGQSLREFAAVNIFGRLHMTHTLFNDSFSEIVHDRATGYRLSRGSGFSTVRTRYPVGSGGVLSSVEDLAIWDHNFYDNKLGQGGSALINKLQTRGKLNSGSEISYACGLQVLNYRGVPMVEHDGANAGFRTELMRFPDQHLSIIVLSNSGAANPKELAQKIADYCLGDRLTAELGGMDEKKSVSATNKPPETVSALPPSSFADYDGTYYSPELGVSYTILPGEREFIVQIGSVSSFRIFRFSGELFGVKNRPSTSFKFTRNADGKVDGFTLEGGRVHHLRFKKTDGATAAPAG